MGWGKAVKAFCSVVDTVNEWAGRFVALLLIPMVVVTSIDVLFRYVFNKPAVWSFDVNIQLMAVTISIGAGYALLHRSHVIVDILVQRFPPRTRAIVDLVTSGIFFLGIAILVWQAFDRAATSTANHEKYSSVFSPPLYPLRIIVAVGFALLLLEGIVKFIRDLKLATTGKEYRP